MAILETPMCKGKILFSGKSWKCFSFTNTLILNIHILNQGGNLWDTLNVPSFEQQCQVSTKQSAGIFV